jgi:hypothetical protein
MGRRGVISGLPEHLNHPQDLFQAVLYAGKVKPKPAKSSKKPKRGAPPQPADYHLWEAKRTCYSCKVKPVPTKISQVCDCAAAPWDNTNTFGWQTANIELRMEDDAFGVATYAGSTFKAHQVLGEYLGEITPPKDTDGSYVFGIENHIAKRAMFNIDSMRLGNWTRFINHSCNPNATFAVVRVGNRVRVIIRTLKGIKAGTEITVHYGEEYWPLFNAKGIWCRCGGADRKWGEKSEKSKKVGAGNAPKKARMKA